MADMVDSGRSWFASWAKGSKYAVRWLGEFDPSMGCKEAAKRLDLVGKISESGIAGFERGWEAEQADYVARKAVKTPMNSGCSAIDSQ